MSGEPSWAEPVAAEDSSCEALVASLAPVGRGKVWAFRYRLPDGPGEPALPGALVGRWRAANGVRVWQGRDGGMVAQTRPYATKASVPSRLHFRALTERGGLVLEGTIQRWYGRVTAAIAVFAAVVLALAVLLALVAAVAERSAAMAAVGVVLVLSLGIFVRGWRAQGPDPAGYLASEVLLVGDAVRELLPAGETSVPAGACDLVPAGEQAAEQEVLRRAIALLRDCPQADRERIEADNAPLSVAQVADILEAAGVDADGVVDRDLLAASRAVLGESMYEPVHDDDSA